MTQSEARDNPHVITGSFLICNSPTLVLVDYRVIYSFVSVSHAKSLNHKIKSLEGGMLISTPSGEVFIVEVVCRDYEIRIENVTMRIDLILFELDEWNVILGMDFLTKYHLVLDCFNKEVVLKELGKLEVKCLGNKKVELVSIISVFKARKLLKKRHIAYLSCIVDT